MVQGVLKYDIVSGLLIQRSPHHIVSSQRIRNSVYWKAKILMINEKESSSIFSNIPYHLSIDLSSSLLIYILYISQQVSAHEWLSHTDLFIHTCWVSLEVILISTIKISHCFQHFLKQTWGRRVLKNLF